MPKREESQGVAAKAQSRSGMEEGYFSTDCHLTAYAAMIEFKVQLRVFHLYSTLNTVYNILTR